MTPEEFDTQLADLETRVDRLRALYENWFRGYEKAEPSVARKEVERKVYAMRKELPRNTALRFRYHQLYQRYTTLASYWQRTARQIEEGTYRLQLKRLKRRNHSVPDENALTMAPRPSIEGLSSGPPAYELRDESLDIKQLLDEAALSSVGDALEQPASKPAAAKSATRRFGRPTATFGEPPTGRSFTLEDRDHDGLTGSASMRAEPSPSMRVSMPSMRGSTPPLARGSERMPSGHPTLPPSARIPAANTGALPGAPRMPVIPPAQSAPPPAPKIPPAPKTGAVPLPPRPAMAATSVPPIPRPPAAPGLGTQASPPRPPPPPPPKTGAFAAPPPTGGLPKPSPRASVPPGRVSAPPAARPAPPRPPVPPPPARPAPPPPAPRPPPAAAARPAPEAPPADQRMRRLYDEYAAARRKNNEGEVRYETLQNSIQKMMPDLRKKHQGKDIDFEVVIKDGRVGLKPKAT